MKNRDINKTCWIVDGHINVVKVRANYDHKEVMWSYQLLNRKNGLGLSGYSSLKPYIIEIIGNSSYYGDGPQFKTKREAKVEQAKIIKEVKKEVRREYKFLLKKRLEKLDEKLN